MTPFRKLRKGIDKDATQREVALSAGVTITTIANWERCKSCPSLTDADSLATVYKTTVAKMEEAILSTSRVVRSSRGSEVGAR